MGLQLPGVCPTWRLRAERWLGKCECQTCKYPNPKEETSEPGEFVVMIAGLMALNALAIDIMLPALDDISAFYTLQNANDQQLVIYAYIFGFGAPQLIWGPLSDSFGRRPVLFVALTGYTIAGLGCILAGSFSQLLALRFVQGVFASGARVVAVSVVRDRFAGRSMARIMSLVMTIFMVVPILAPGIGQLILFVAPWEWIFGALTIFGGFMLAWTFLRLPETLPDAARRPLNLGSSAQSYVDVFRSRVTTGYMVASGVIFGSLFAFIGSVEQVFTEVFGKEEDFVIWFAIIALGLSGANFINSQLVERFGMRRISQIALIGFISVAVLLLTLMQTVGEVFLIFFPLFMLMFACFGLIGPNFNALAMEPLGKMAGTGSAAYGFATTTFSSLLGWMIGSQYNGTSIPLLAGFAGLGVLTLIVVTATERGKLFQAGR